MMNNEREKFVSIAMATYNGEKYLPEQLDSILNQTHRNFELIISDDGSNDKTLKILYDYQKKDNRIRILTNNGEHGCGKNFENALMNCSGEYIAFSDQDDVWTNNHIEHLLNIIKNKSMAMANAEAVDENLNSLNYDWKTHFFINDENLNNNLLLHILFLCFVQGTALLFNRELLKSLPIEFGINHDYHFALAAIMTGGLTYSDEVILKYRQHSNNVCGIQNQTLFEKINDIFANSRLRRNVFNSANIILERMSEIITPETKQEINDTFSIWRKIVIQKNLFVFKKYYSVIFWDNDKSKLLTRYLLYII